MTLYQFNVLTENEKTAIVSSKGHFVGDRKEDNFSIMLYQVRSFYVELYYNGQENKIRKLRSFSSREQLEPYLGKIDIFGWCPAVINFISEEITYLTTGEINAANFPTNKVI